MDEKTIIKGYKEYLIENVGLTKNSANQYCSYIRNLFKVIGMSNSIINVLNTSVLYSLKAEKRGRVELFINDLIVDAIEKESDDSKRKSLRDGKSAIIHFWDYLSEYDEEILSDNLDELDVIYKALCSASEYIHNQFIVMSAEDFKKRLLQQFKTENRTKVSGTDVCYPIQTILPMLNDQQKEIINKRFNKQINNTEIIVSQNGKRITVEAIKEIRYAPGKQCEVTDLNNVIHYVFTGCASPSTYEPLICNEQRNISRDHKKPISIAMTDLYNKGELSKLSELTNAIYNYDKNIREPLVSGKGGIGITKAREILKKDNPQFDESFFDELLKEFEMLEEEIGGYEIMHSSNNTEKGGSNRK